MNTKCKIFILVSNDLTSEQRMDRTAMYLSSLGHDVTLIGRISGNQSQLNQRTYNTFRIQCHITKGMLMYAEFTLKLIKFIIKHHSDIIISVDIDTILAGAFAKRFKKTRYLIYDSHELFTEVPELENKVIKKTIWSFIGRICVPLAKVCVTVNGSLSKILSQSYKKDFSVIWNAPPFNTDQPKLPSPHPKPYILYQGAVNKGRGIEQLIDAMPLIDKNLDLLIVGHGDLIEDIKNKAAQSSEKNRIHIIGFVYPDQLPSYTSNAFVGVNLLVSESKNYFYSLANKFFDYVHSGVPAIHMHFPEYVNLINEYKVGLTIENLSQTNISAAINKLYKEPELYQSIQVNCRIASSVWNWQNESVKWKKIIDRLDN